MTDKELIAERTIYAVSEDGNSFEIRLMIGKPYQTDSGEWACPVALSGLHDRLHDMLGSDSWQSMIVAIHLMKLLLGFFVEAGGKLFTEQGGSEISLNDIFLDEAPSSEPEVPQPDEPLSSEQQVLVDDLAPGELKAIDDVILANCSVQFRKVARVVGGVMETNAAAGKRTPATFYAQRVYKLVEMGKLISEGKLGYMRFCEVRLPSLGD